MECFDAQSTLSNFEGNKLEHAHLTTTHSRTIDGDGGKSHVQQFRPLQPENSQRQYRPLLPKYAHDATFAASKCITPELLHLILKKADKKGLTYVEVMEKVTQTGIPRDVLAQSQFNDSLHKASVYKPELRRFFAKSETVVEHEQELKPVVIDLTKDDDCDENHVRKDDTIPGPNAVLAPTSCTSESSISLPSKYTHPTDTQSISEAKLAEARYACRQRGHYLPGTIKTWAELKEFVSLHPSTGITLETCQRVQLEGLDSSPEPRSSQRLSGTIANSVDEVTKQKGMGRENPNRSKRKHGSKQIAQHQETKPSTKNSETRSSSPSKKKPPNEQQHNILRHLDTCPDMLPPEAPAGCPHLISIWDDVLLNLPLKQNDHLQLPDVAVSILYRYDTSTGETLNAFLDRDKVRHFFFLFKSRSYKAHSWSIEREDDIVTVGIERSSRGNNSGSIKPSNGQFDLYGSFRLQRISDENLYMHRWDPRSFTFPVSPDPFNFLFSTPPDRGADTRETFHPPHHRVPQHYLSLLSRYMQQTVMRSTAMDAEFQIVWGRKVRYDAVLGRVRALWDNALKSAATQRERRARGEYDRNRRAEFREAMEGDDFEEDWEDGLEFSTTNRMNVKKTRCGKKVSC